MGQVAVRMAQVALGCQRLTCLTLISICSSISLFLMAAYSFSSLLGTWGQAGTRGRGPDPPGPVLHGCRGDPTQAQETVSPLHLLGVVLDLEGPEDELVGATVELVWDHLLEVLWVRKPAMKHGPKIQAIT